MPDTTAELVLDSHAILGEGPLWHTRRQTLFWINIIGKELHEFNPRTGRDRAIDLGQYIGSVIPRKRGGLMLSLQHGIARFNFRNRKYKIVSRPDHRPGNRFNDGKCDAAGRLWAGTMSIKLKPRQGSLFRFQRDMTFTRMLSNLSIANGMAWSADARTMYFIDTPTQAVAAFDFDVATGKISNRRYVVRIPKRDGSPDGMTIDSEDMLWVAHWGGWRVTRWNPKTGRLLQTIKLPVSQVSCCTFGGKNLDELYITSARENLTPAQLEKEPHAGGLFRAKPGVTGVPAEEFAG